MTSDLSSSRTSPCDKVISLNERRPVCNRATLLKSYIEKIPFLGLAIAFVSSGLFGLQNVIVKHVRSIDPFTIATYRFSGIVLPAVCITIYRSEDVRPAGKVKWLVFRSVAGCTNLIIHYYGLKHMPIADANMIASASPVFVAIFGRLFLKEACGVFEVLNIAITLVGIVLIIKPPFLFGYGEEFQVDHEYYVAAAVLFLGSLLQANVYILLRMLKDISFPVTLTYFGTIGVLECSAAMFTLGTLCIPACGFDRLMMVAVGLVSFFGQTMLTVAFKYEDAGKISLTRKSGDIIFAFLFQIVIFQDIPGMLSLLGAVLVSLAVIISGTKKIVDNLPEDHQIKVKHLRLFYKKTENKNL